MPFSSGPQPSLHVARAGHAPSWLFLHAAGSTGSSFFGITRRLASDIVPLTPDLTPDAPRSEGSERPLLPDDVERALAILRDQARPLVVVGHSYGAVVALELARRRPALVERLVLIEPLALQLLAGDTSAQAQQLSALTTRVCELVNHGAHREAARLLLSYWDESAWAKLPDARRVRLALHMPRITRTLRELATLRVGLDDYAGLHTPALVLRGTRSPGPTRFIAAQLARALPQAMLFDIAGAGHLCTASHANEIAFLLRRVVLKGAFPLSPVSG